MVEGSTNLLRLSSQMAALGQPERLERRAVHRIAKPGIGKVQAQHTEQRVEQCTRNLG